MIATSLFSILLTPGLAYSDELMNDYARADILIKAGKLHEGIRALDAAYALVADPKRADGRRGVEESNILEAEFDPLRRIGNVARLNRILAKFAKLADRSSMPRESSLPKMRATPERFSVEEKLFKSELSGIWNIFDSDTISTIDHSLQQAAHADYQGALWTLTYFGTEKVEFYWYYRAWIYAAEGMQPESVNAFFSTFNTRTALPEGNYWSIHVDSARHLSELPESALRE